MKKTVILFLVLLMLDVAVWWLVFHTDEPEYLEGNGLSIIVLTLFISVVNVLLCLISLIWKKTRFAWSPFFANAFFSFGIIWALVMVQINSVPQPTHHALEFQYEDAGYRLSWISYHPDPRPYFAGDEDIFYLDVNDGRWRRDKKGYGVAIHRNDTIFFHRPDTAVFYIYGEYIHGFGRADSIRVTRNSPAD